MGRWLVERKLKQTSARLSRLRDELGVIDEQLDHFASDEDDAGIRALVSESPGARSEARDAQAHAEAMRKHRSHVVEEIAALERRQDELLDSLSRPA